ncbi:MAG: hypothetical protein N2Z22_09990 [Turneriella sp.]|nr:hypothetical protein [Turneriella sp.]
MPPFEDMNNRRPPTCKSLHLDETKLDQEYPNWRDWTEKLVAQFQHVYELENYAEDPELKYITEYYTNSRQSTAHKKAKGIHATLLQRILDRSSDLDEYRLRAQVQTVRLVAAGEIVPDRLRNAYETGRKNLIQAVGETAAKKIIKLAEHYYQEIENAKRGLWLPEEKNNITFRCDRKPRQKKNLREELVGHILATDFSNKSKWNAWEELYHQPKMINNRSSIASICGNIEKTRKDLGDEFHFYWNRIRHSGFKPNPEDNVEKEVLKHVKNAEEVANVIAQFLQHDAKMRNKYANPYSLAQLYIIMEGDVAGFHRTCPACTRENFWRSSPAAAAAERRDGTTPARAVRLAADTMRPFDGFLARYLERIGEKIAHLKWRQLSVSNGANAVLVPILLEQNRFRFNSDMAEIKASMRRKQAKEKLQRAEKRFEDKWERIRKAGKGICPYTGEAIGSSGEFDHILPRSYSKGSFGTVFNTEINLIYATSTGNRQKGDRFYTLDNLHPKYLERLYKTTDTKAIRAHINTTLQKFTKARSVYFHNLSEEEQRDFRHALFDKSLLKQVQDLLHTQYKMRVSGMQGYLARVIYEKLLQLNREKKLPLHFAVFAYDAGDDSLASRRKNLETHNSIYAKPRESAQPPGSHVIDAAMVWAHALERDDIPGLPKGLLLEGDSLEELLPERLEIISLAARDKYRRKRPQSMQIFKDTIYAERYLSLIIGRNQCGFGYDLNNMVKFDKNLLPQIFDLLKPFIAYHGKPVSAELNDYEIPKNKKFIYFNIVRERAAEFLQQNAYSDNLTQRERNQMALLSGLRYFTLKSEIFSTLSDPQGTAKSLFTKENDIQKFSAKVDVRLQLESQNKALRIQGKVELPQLVSWQSFLSNKTVKELIKNSRKWQELDPSKIVDLTNQYFRKTVTNPLRHHGVRKVYSLPLMQAPSGGFRIQRRRGESRQFHVQAIEGSKFAGFAVRDGKVDFGAPSIMPLLVKQGSLAPVDGYVGKMPKEFVFMDEWREIPSNEFAQPNLPVSKLWLQPNSESRMRVRMEVDSKALFSGDKGWHLVAPLMINMDKKAEDKEIQKLQKNLSQILDSLQLKPRDKVTLVAADGKKTIYEFIVQSTNAAMRQWYNSGTACVI